MSAGGGGGFGFGRPMGSGPPQGYVSAFARSSAQMDPPGGGFGAKPASAFGFGRSYLDAPSHSVPLSTRPPAFGGGSSASLNDYAMSSLPSIRVTSRAASTQILHPSSATTADASDVNLVSPAMSLVSEGGGAGSIRSPSAGGGGSAMAAGQGGRRFGFGISRRSSHITPKAEASGADGEDLPQEEGAAGGGRGADGDDGADEMAIKVEVPEPADEEERAMKAEEEAAALAEAAAAARQVCPL